MTVNHINIMPDNYCQLHYLYSILFIYIYNLENNIFLHDQPHELYSFSFLQHTY